VTPSTLRRQWVSICVQYVPPHALGPGFSLLALLQSADQSIMYGLAITDEAGIEQIVM